MGESVKVPRGTSVPKLLAVAMRMYARRGRLLGKDGTYALLRRLIVEQATPSEAAAEFRIAEKNVRKLLAGFREEIEDVRVKEALEPEEFAMDL